MVVQTSFTCSLQEVLPCRDLHSLSKYLELSHLYYIAETAVAHQRLPKVDCKHHSSYPRNDAASDVSFFSSSTLVFPGRYIDGLSCSFLH